ncbi:type I polyketide synthase [Nocardiopsis ansamitocini]|uniref:Polyketide synthase n=1 Tax=Nocardiopsis ansamitocini TaxID=1670832 RepID=A0A9W6P7Z8_9ACTN|nr:type I polyketide synthase [Nocardiopsis ansamitocini]GLU48732.1 polyketide synthase [Nocardiopsis ansamitocini]
MSSERIAIVGIGLRYPDAGSPGELWDNVLAGRRAFRRLPDGRMNRADYWSPDPKDPDRFYSDRAAVLRDYAFDRLKYRVAGSTYRSTDMTHWLALDVAAHALADAGFPDAEGLPRTSTGVVVGNSLTGEFSRANTMRLRWPYVRRTLAAAFAEKGWDEEETAAFLGEFEARYKAPFPTINEDTLAGGLSNTIAGRICNHFDFGGGGYTVDGACSSSLLSVVTAATALSNGDLDVVLAGGVDLSIDPFEVIGFAKTGALATGEMKVYDRDSNGFWPGEGAGLLVLMREADARERGARVYATLAGWAVSSDGKGGMTRPEESGHRLALSRAYDRAGYGVETVSYFEGHGTGTALGDATEIAALSGARRDAAPDAPPAALSTVKGNFGHTKAAAGVAGLIKATLAVHHQVIPPATGHRTPHPLLAEDRPAMYVPDSARLWPEDQPVRAGVSAMGFGGINTHIAVEQARGTDRRTDLDARTAALVTGRQDAELLLFDAADPAELREKAARTEGFVSTLALAELADLAGTLAAELSDAPLRAAVVATSPDDAERALTRLLELLDDGRTSAVLAQEGVFLGDRATAPRITFLFPGQGSGSGAVGALQRRFPVAQETFRAAGLPTGGDQVATQVAQPRIAAGSLAALRVLQALGIDADTAVGHSLGELTALHWGGAMDAGQLLELAADRGRAMAGASRGGGAMAGLGAGPERVARLVEDSEAVIAGYNGPEQTVVSGPAGAVDRVCALAAENAIHATRVNVSHAFHSPLVEPAATALAEPLARLRTAPLHRPVVSTVTGGLLTPDTDLRALLRDQVVLPVRFHEAAAAATEQADLALEVGPGRVLSGLLTAIAPNTPTLPLDTDHASLAPFLRAVGAAYALGAAVDTTALFTGRALRPIPLDGQMAFLESPCEAAPAIDAALAAPSPVDAGETADTTPTGEQDTLELLRRLAADRVELPLEVVGARTHPMDDLHLSSITVGQIVNQATRELGRPTLETTSSFATLNLGDLAHMIDDLAETAADGSPAEAEAAGIGSWVRAFGIDHVETAPVTAVETGQQPSGQWEVHAPPGHPLAEPLRTALSTAGVGDGVLLCLPADGREHVGLLLAAGRAAATAPAGTRFVAVHHRFGAAGLAKTLHLEAPAVTTTLVGLADTEPATDDGVTAAVRRVVAETAATTGFTEAAYDASGTRTVPVLRPAASGTRSDAEPALGPGDVLLVTGGGKGITAECAMAMAQDSRARLALVGRADPEQDTELADNLARMSAAGIEHRYERADVASPEQVRAAVGRLEHALGRVTAVLHGAGRNEPAALTALAEETFHQTLAPKTDGLANVLAAVDPDRVGLLITFGSIIGRAGLRGEAHYATANAWLTEMTLDFQRAHPHARVLAMEWSVWSGAGMGERLGVVEALSREGITPISAEDGIATLRRLLADPSTPPALVVSGRAAGLPTLAMAERELPLLRFVDRVLVHYPEIELVTEVDLAPGSDPYLDDHRLEGDLLFPAVIGMEAMTQVAAALTGNEGPPLLEDAEFLRPVVVRPGGSTTIRLAALAEDASTVRIALRSEETGFDADHFRAVLRWPRPLPREDVLPEGVALPPVPVDPVAELYGGVLFQGKRFQRLLAYRRTAARHAVAEIATASPGPWFAPYLPQDRLLADPGTRDAMMHALQCCVPDATLLPESIERLHLADPAGPDTDYVLLDARERSQEGDSHTYDIQVRTPSGRVVEHWEGLRLRAVRRRDGSGPWVPSLLGPYLERALERVVGGSRAVVVEPDPAAEQAGVTPRGQTELALGRALGRPAQLRHRPDGKPETDGARLSASHGAGLTLVVAGDGRLACDVETVAERTDADWAGLLGSAQSLSARITAEAGCAEPVAATRVWGALECLRKSGDTGRALTLDTVHPGGWVVLRAGDAVIATWATTVEGRPEPVVFAVLQGKD